MPSKNTTYEEVLYSLITQLDINLDNIGEEGKIFKFEITNFDVSLSLKLKHPKEKKINNNNRNNQKNNLIQNNSSTEKKNNISISSNEEISNEKNDAENTSNIKNINNLNYKNSLYKENNSKLNNNERKRTQSLQNNKNLQFKYSLGNDEIKNKKNKISNSREKIKEINEEEENKPKGLLNLGLSCYMNSLLQCLFYIKEFRDYFIEYQNEFGDEQQTCKAFAEVMNGLKNDEKDYFAPNGFKKLMGNKNSLLLGRKDGDAKDLFFNLIDAFLSELINENESNNKSCVSEFNYNDKKKMFDETLKEIDQINIINKLFIGYYYTQYYCKEKKINTFSFQTESFILFDLEKIQNHFNNKKLSIDLCFKYYFKKTSLSSFYCNKCEKTHKGQSYENIYRPPKILVLILDRGHGKTFKKEVEIKNILDLRNYIEEENYEFSSLYKLICISTHEGKSSSTGHYTARCLTDNNKYYYFSDKYVEEINEEDLFENEPYLLFYQQIDINDNKDKNNNSITINELNRKKNNIKNNNIKNIVEGQKNQNKEDNKKYYKRPTNNERFKEKNSILELNIKKQKNDYRQSNQSNRTKNEISMDSESKPIYNKRNIDSKQGYSRFVYNFNKEEIKKTLQKFLKKTNQKYKIEYFFKAIEDPLLWKLIINGPKNSIYEGGQYYFKLNFQRGFNKITDHITVQNKFYHLNFGKKEGPLLFDIDYDNSKSFYDNLKELFNSIYELFIEPDCELSKDNILAKEKIKEYKNDINLYNKKVKESILYMLR